MISFQQFKSIEEKYPTQNIKLGDEPIWTYLRIYAYDKAYTGKGTQQSVKNFSFLFLLKCLLWKLPYFKKFKVLVLSSSDQRKPIDGYFFDRQDFEDSLKNHALFVELPSPNHKPRGKLASKNIYSKMWWYGVELILQKFVKIPTLSGEKIWQDLIAELNISLNINELCTKFHAQYLFTKFVLKFHGIQTIMLTTPYTNMARILAAKHLGIKVIEFQHGLISANHNAYQLPPNPNRKLLPDSIFTFGEAERDVLSQTGYLPVDCIFPVGSFYIDWLAKQPNHKMETTNELKICFTAQDHHIAETITFLNAWVQIAENCSFIFIERKLPIEHYYAQGLSNKIRTEPGKNTYQLMAECHFHCTIYSTCATESLALGTPSILMNIFNLSEIHFGKLSIENPYLNIANNAKEANKMLSEMWPYTPEEVKTSIEYQFKKGYIKNLNQQLKNNIG